MKRESVHGTITDKDWESIFMVPALAPEDNKIKDLQYKIIMRFTPTNHLLHKMKKISSPTCNFCNLETETVEHLFFDCTHVKDIWLFAFDEFQKLSGFYFVPTLRSCILGIYDVNVEKSWITVNQQILAAIKFGISQSKVIYVNLASIKFGVSLQPVYVVYDRRICWQRQILGKTRNSPNSPNIVARPNLLIYSINTIMLLVKMYIMKCKYETCNLCRIAYRNLAEKSTLDFCVIHILM